MSAHIHTCECGFSWKHGLSGSHNCSPYYRKTIAELRAALASHQGVAVPAGYAIVPLEPTPGMVVAAAEELWGHTRAQAVEWAKLDKFESHGERGRDSYCAMLAAAPQPPAVKEAAPAPATLTDEEIEQHIDRPGFAWENLTKAEQRNLLDGIRGLLAAAGNSQGLDGGSHG